MERPSAAIQNLGPLNSPSHPRFDLEHAATYDARFAKLQAFRDARHLVAAGVLLDLPPDARILCVGDGTGAEIPALAERFPGWHFTAVEASGAMLDACRRKAEAAGSRSKAFAPPTAATSRSLRRRRLNH